MHVVSLLLRLSINQSVKSPISLCHTSIGQSHQSVSLSYSLSITDSPFLDLAPTFSLEGHRTIVLVTSCTRAKNSSADSLLAPPSVIQTSDTTALITDSFKYKVQFQYLDNCAPISSYYRTLSLYLSPSTCPLPVISFSSFLRSTKNLFSVWLGRPQNLRKSSVTDDALVRGALPSTEVAAHTHRRI